MTIAFPRIGLTGKPGDEAVRKVLAQVGAHLGARGVEVLELGPGHAGSEIDLVISVGGDGTLLHAARQFGIDGTPVLGVNLGHLGFLVDIMPDAVKQALDAVLAGKYSEERRTLLEMSTIEGGRTVGSGVALNDVVLHRAEPGRLLEFSTHIDGAGVSLHRADGIVVATPTGSTAYALSCGGPILHPALDAIALVPISPHTLSDRPLVVAASVRIRLTVGMDTGGAMVTCDGQTGVTLAPGASVEIRRSERTLRLLHPLEYDYFRILRDKLRWGRAPEQRPGD